MTSSRIVEAPLLGALMRVDVQAASYMIEDAMNRAPRQGWMKRIREILKRGET